MRKYLMALAATALLASQAGAATISGPTSVTAGVVNTFFYTANAPAEVIPGHTLFTMHLEINGGDPATGGGIRDYWGDTYTDGMIFSFNWVFDTTGPASLSISSVLVTYVNSTIQFGNGFFFVDKGDEGGGLPFNSGFEFEGGGGPPVTLQISVVPIGGTLPLLLSALGALGWAARRRSKAAALPA